MLDAVPDAVVFSGDAGRLDNTLAIAHPEIDAETMVMSFDLDCVAISAGSACSSGRMEPSAVIEAMGFPSLSRHAVRLSLGWSSAPEDCDAAVRAWKAADTRHRARRQAGAMTPLYLDCKRHHSGGSRRRRCHDALVPRAVRQSALGQPHVRDGCRCRRRDARRSIARLVGADAREIIFTSGATESNNLAIKGAARFERRMRGRRNRIITVASEHKCVLESVKALEAEGFATDVLPVGTDGTVETERLARALDDDVILVSVMAANNEIGTLQPLADIGAMTRACGRPLSLRWGPGRRTDTARCQRSSHRSDEFLRPQGLRTEGHRRPLCAPPAAGADRTAVFRWRPGTDPAFGHRAGTPGHRLRQGSGPRRRPARWRKRQGSTPSRAPLINGLPGVSLNGPPLDSRLPGNLNLLIEGVDAGHLISRVPELAFSTGSACTSAVVEPSYVLRAIGLTPGQAASSIRLGIGRFTTSHDIAFANERLTHAINRCRREA